MVLCCTKQLAESAVASNIQIICAGWGRGEALNARSPGRPIQLIWAASGQAAQAKRGCEGLGMGGACSQPREQTKILPAFLP